MINKNAIKINKCGYCSVEKKDSAPVILVMIVQYYLLSDMCELNTIKNWTTNVNFLNDILWRVP